MVLFEVGSCPRSCLEELRKIMKTFSHARIMIASQNFPDCPRGALTRYKIVVCVARYH